MCTYLGCLASQLGRHCAHELHRVGLVVAQGSGLVEVGDQPADQIARDVALPYEVAQLTNRPPAAREQDAEMRINKARKVSEAEKQPAWPDIQHA